jgi:hypothetical protein
MEIQQREHATMKNLLAIVTLSLVLGLAPAAQAQIVYQTYSPVVSGFDGLTNTVVSSYRPVVAAYAPAVAYSPVVTSYSPVVTSYSPVVTSAYSPVVTAYSPVVTTAYSPVVGTAYSPVVAYSPVTSYLPMTAYTPVTSYYAPVYVRPLYVPGEPVRNFFRARRY